MMVLVASNKEKCVTYGPHIWRGMARCVVDLMDRMWLSFHPLGPIYNRGFP